MKIIRFVSLMLALVIFTGCSQAPHSPTYPPTEQAPETEMPSSTEETSPVSIPTEEALSATESPTTETASGQQETGSDRHVPSWTNPSSNNADKETAPPENTTEKETSVTESSATEPPVTQETGQESAETQPPETMPAEETPDETQQQETEPPATEETEPPATEEPEVTEITYEFKRQVAAYAVQYINQYRGSPCTVLSGMSSVAQYRASQLTWNYGHSTADKRAALAAYEYGRYIDATEFGDDPSNSYWEADSAEAICAGFYGTDPEAMGRKIADLIRNSSGHWSYISSSEYSYIGVGVEYREGSQYGWYCCVMVGSVDYG